MPNVEHVASREALKLTAALERGPVIWRVTSRRVTAHTALALNSVHRPVIWVDLRARDTENAVSLGNRLSEIVNRVVGYSLLSLGMPLKHNLSLLMKKSRLIGEVLLFITGLQHGDQMARDLLASPHPLLALVIVDEQGHLGASELDVQVVDAPGAFPEDDAAAGALPTVNGFGFEDSCDAQSDEARIDYLYRQGRILQAFEQAVVARPQWAAQKLSVVGPRYLASGRHAKLWRLLHLVTDPASTEQVLRWLLLCAIRMGTAGELSARVTAYLERYPAPELRATFAGLVLNTPDALAHATRATQDLESPVTLGFSGTLHSQLGLREDGIALLKRAVAASERQGERCDVIRSAAWLGMAYEEAGQMPQAVHWYRWALHLLEHHEFSDGYLKLLISVRLALVSLMTNDPPLNVEDLEEQVQLADAQEISQVFTYFRVLHLLSVRDVLAASQLAAQAHQSAPRSALGQWAYALTLCQAHQGRWAEARAVAAQAVTLTEDTGARNLAFARLARALMSAPSAEVQAELTALAGSAALPATYQVQAACWSAPPEACTWQWSETARAVFFPAQARPVDGTHAHASPQLRIELLGKPRVTFQGAVITPNTRLLEALAILCLYPEGLTLPQLTFLLYGDDGNHNTTKATLSRLRRILPVSHAPYRLHRPYQLDVDDLRAALDSGQLDEVQRYGTLLAFSDVPALVSWREEMQQMTSSFIRTSMNPEAILNRGERMRDLALLEFGLSLTPQSHPRHASAASLVQSMRAEFDLP